MLLKSEKLFVHKQLTNQFYKDETLGGRLTVNLDFHNNHETPISPLYFRHSFLCIFSSSTLNEPF